MKKITMALFIIMLSHFASAQDGVADMSFGTSGYVNINNNDGATFDRVVQPDGKILYIQGTKFRRLNANGTQDATFGVAGGVTIVQPGQNIQGFIVLNNKITLITKSLYETYTMGRYNFDGTPDTTFETGGQGFMTIDLGDDIEEGVTPRISLDGKILLGGNSSTAYGNYNDYYVRKYNLDGTLDDTFNYFAYSLGINVGTSGIGLPSDESETDLDITSSGDVIISGISTYYNSSSTEGFRASLAIIRPGENLPQIKVGSYTDFYGTIKSNTFVDQNDNIWLLTGKRYDNGSGSNPVNVIQKWTAAGNNDNTFGTSGSMTIALSLDANTKADFSKIMVQPDGKILLAGVTATLTGGLSWPNMILARYLANGTLDITFGNGGYVLHDIDHPNTSANFNQFAELFASADFSSIYITGRNLQNTTIFKYNNDSLLQPVAPEFAQVAPICSGETLAALPTTSENGVTGTWAPAINNSATTAYTFTPTAGLNATAATMTITVNQPTASTVTETVCDTYTWAANGTTYTTGGIYTNVTTNAAGCTDTATLNLTVNHATSSSATVSACDTFTWSANGNVYIASGTYTNVTTNASGCSNTATLNLTVNHATSATATVSSCDSYTWAANGNVYTASGTYTNVTTNASGCSNTATLNLTIESAETPTGAPNQSFVVDNLNDATISDIVVSPATVVWYATLSDALAQINPIAGTTVLTDDATYYAVHSTAQGCDSTPFAVTVSVSLALGSDSFDNAGFRLYPNPASDVIAIAYAKEITDVRVINLLGQQVIAKPIHANEGTIDVSGLSSGTYFVKVTAGQRVKTLKIIKK